MCAKVSRKIVKAVKTPARRRTQSDDESSPESRSPLRSLRVLSDTNRSSIVTTHSNESSTSSSNNSNSNSNNSNDSPETSIDDLGYQFPKGTPTQTPNRSKGRPLPSSVSRIPQRISQRVPATPKSSRPSVNANASTSRPSYSARKSANPLEDTQRGRPRKQAKPKSRKEHALREIRRYQKSTELLMRKLPFQRYVIDIHNLNSNKRIHLVENNKSK